MYDQRRPAKIKAPGRSTNNNVVTYQGCVADDPPRCGSCISLLPLPPSFLALTAQGSRRADGALQGNQGQAHDGVCAVCRVG